MIELSSLIISFLGLFVGVIVLIKSSDTIMRRIGICSIIIGIIFFFIGIFSLIGGFHPKETITPIQT